MNLRALWFQPLLTLVGKQEDKWHILKQLFHKNMMMHGLNNASGGSLVVALPCVCLSFLILKVALNMYNTRNFSGKGYYFVLNPQAICF